MRRRPQPNRRRGLLRASAAALILIAFLAGAILLVSSLTAPSVNAPIIVPTPAAPRTPGRGTPVGPPRTSRPLSPRPVATQPPTPQATHKAKRDVALGDPGSAAFDRLPASGVIGTMAKIRRQARGHPLSWFSGSGDAYTGKVLHIESNRHTRLVVGRADPYVRPVFSPDGRYLLFVRVRQTARYPGAEWSLLRYDTVNRASSLLSRSPALNLEPLGWSGGQPLYLVATSSDTSVFAVGNKGPRFVSILIPQPATASSLSPDGKWIAFAAPASCSYCTLDLFDLGSHTLWNGPSGLPGENAFVWMNDSSAVVAHVNKSLEAIAPEGHDVVSFAVPRGLDLVWDHDIIATRRGGRLHLRDLSTGREYVGGRAPTR